MTFSEVSTIEEELALAQAESRDMKRTVVALRTELESAHAEVHATTLRVTQTAAAEISQLKVTVGALREELERAHVEREKAVQHERVAASQALGIGLAARHQHATVVQKLRGMIGSPRRQRHRFNPGVGLSLIHI